MTPLEHNRCPLCGAALWAPDAENIATKKCPRCGAELWVLRGSLFFLRQPGQDKYSFLGTLPGPLAGASAAEIEAFLKGADSLDWVEFVMEIEDAMKSGHC